MRRSKYMAYTGGPLNELNGQAGISAPSKSVPVMKLIRAHMPKSKAELVELIAQHAASKCECGVRSTGTVADFGNRLFEAQMPAWGEQRFTLTQCIQWEYDLFVVQSLKGGLLEKKALGLIRSLMPEVEVEEAEGYLDEELRIDLIVAHQNNKIAGIQVKPSSFKSMRTAVIAQNVRANSQWNKPVLYLYYDEKEQFENLNEVVTQLSAIRSQKMSINYNNKRFKPVASTENGEVSEETTFLYQQEGNVLTAKYSGGTIVHGHLIGLVDAKGHIDMRYHQVNSHGVLMTGVCRSRPEILPNGKIRLHEEWQWTSGDGSKGTSVIEEI